MKTFKTYVRTFFPSLPDGKVFRKVSEKNYLFIKNEKVLASVYAIQPVFISHLFQSDQNLRNERTLLTKSYFHNHWEGVKFDMTKIQRERDRKHCEIINNVMYYKITIIAKELYERRRNWEKKKKKNVRQ